MTEQVTGKATAELFEQVILRRLGAPDPDVLTPPRHGVDVGVVRVADGVVMALTADPVFVAVRVADQLEPRPDDAKAVKRAAG